MATYLDGGWYEPKGGLRTAVIDAAMDIAGGLLRAEVPAALVERLALATRKQIVMLDPHLRGATFGAPEHELLSERLMLLADRTPELASFVGDCIESLKTSKDVLAFYLHLVHVARMMQLLSVAMHAEALLGKRPTRPKRARESARPKARKRTTKTSRTSPRPGARTKAARPGAKKPKAGRSHRR